MSRTLPSNVIAMCIHCIGARPATSSTVVDRAAICVCSVNVTCASRSPPAIASAKVPEVLSGEQVSSRAVRWYWKCEQLAENCRFVLLPPVEQQPQCECERLAQFRRVAVESVTRLLRIIPALLVGRRVSSVSYHSLIVSVLVIITILMMIDMEQCPRLMALLFGWTR